MSVVTEETGKSTRRKSTTEYAAIADSLLADIKALDQRMEKDRAEIDCLKAESARLQADNETILSRLKAMI